MLNYGNVRIDMQGQWDIETDKVVDPKGLKAYLETRIFNPINMNFIARS